MTGRSQGLDEPQLILEKQTESIAALLEVYSAWEPLMSFPAARNESSSCDDGVRTAGGRTVAGGSPGPCSLWPTPSIRHPAHMVLARAMPCHGRIKGVSPRSRLTKREAILNATLDIVVERGLHDAPMSVIAERAGASAGVIYHHFRSKEEILQALYERTRMLQEDSFFRGYSPEMGARDAFLQAWSNGYRYYRKHSREMRFLEQYHAAGLACPPHQTFTSGLALQFERRFRARAKGGVLNDWPKQVLHETTVGLVMRLAQLPVRLSESTLQSIAANMWEAIRAPEKTPD